MTQRSDSATTRRSILSAAQHIVAKEGVAQLTIDAVAKTAGVSKGAVLYHFASKNALVQGMIASMVEEFDEVLKKFSTAERGKPGGTTRAYVKASLAFDQQDEAASALIAAVATNPELLVPLRTRFAEWQASVEKDGIDPARATIVRLAIDGWWLCALFGFPLSNRRLQQKVVAELMRLTRQK